MLFYFNHLTYDIYLHILVWYNAVCKRYPLFRPILKALWKCNRFFVWDYATLFIIDHVALAKQGDNRFGSVCPSI